MKSKLIFSEEIIKTKGLEKERHTVLCTAQHIYQTTTQSGTQNFWPELQDNKADTRGQQCFGLNNVF